MKKVNNLLRKSIYIILGSLDRVLSHENNIVIYCYHGINNNSWAYNVSLEHFTAQMEYLSKWGTPVTLSDIESYIKSGKKLPKKCFAITFDDGYRTVISTIKPTKRLGINPTLFILANPNNPDRSDMGTQSILVGKKDIQKLINSGWSIGSHGLNHKRLSKISKDELIKEIEDSKEILEKITKNKIDYFAYPHGEYNQAVLSTVKKSQYLLGVSMDDNFISRNTELLTIPRVGVMGTHSMSEFRYIASPSVVKFRNLIKKSTLRKYI